MLGLGSVPEERCRDSHHRLFSACLEGHNFSYIDAGSRQFVLAQGAESAVTPGWQRNMWSLSRVRAAVMFGKAGSPPAREDIDDFRFSLLRGPAAVANLA